MRILAFDSCFGALSVAVARAAPTGVQVLAQAGERPRSGASERLLPLIASALERAGMGFEDVERLAVTLGPGSFTGVRTGVAVARALALAIGCEAVGVGCLAAIAFAERQRLGPARQGQALAVALDARLGMVYFQRFGGGAEGESVPSLLTPADCARALGTLPTRIVGSAADAVLQAALAEGKAAEADLPDAEPDAAALAVLAPDLVPGPPLRPLYLRAPDAKPQAGHALPRAPT
jgi:tRNA threonylcarbamoyladenosine biosynthesis protein TsaB